MDKRRTDPMLQKMVSTEQRANELRLLKEYELAGKIRRIDYVAPESEEEEDARVRDLEVTDLGDGNKWRRPEE